MSISINGTSGITFADSSVQVTSGQPRLMTAINTTSGTAFDITDIPSWVKRITVMFSGVSTNGASTPIIQIGDSEGIETTGYTSTVLQLQAANVVLSATTGFAVAGSGATYFLHGAIRITNFNSTSWVVEGNVYTTVPNVNASAGSKALSATLDRIRITTVNGTDTFDAGTINIMYE